MCTTRPTEGILFHAFLNSFSFLGDQIFPNLNCSLLFSRFGVEQHKASVPNEHYQLCRVRGGNCTSNTFGHHTVSNNVEVLSPYLFGIYTMDC